MSFLRDSSHVSYTIFSRLQIAKTRTGDDMLATPVEAIIRPRERAAQIQAMVERDLATRKEKDTPHWEDAIDNPYQARPIPPAERLMKFITPSASPAKYASIDADEARPRQGQALRLRVGRGGRLHLDRRRPPPSAIQDVHPFSRMESEDDSDDTGDDSELDALLVGEVEETRRRLKEQWRFDEDDGPAVGPLGSEEQDRILVDDFQTKWVHICYYINDGLIGRFQTHGTHCYTPQRIRCAGHDVN
jgi:enhancer of polycomb-like protein